LAADDVLLEFSFQGETNIVIITQNSI